MTDAVYVEDIQLRGADGQVLFTVPVGRMIQPGDTVSATYLPPPFS